MKKITVLILFAVIMTIGGVFATWTYAQESIAQKNVYIKSQIKMSDISNSNARGAIEVDLSRDASFWSCLRSLFCPSLKRK